MKRTQRAAVLAGLAAAGLAFYITKRTHPITLIEKAVKGLRIFFERLHEQGVPAVRLWLRDHILRGIQGVSPADTSRVTSGLYVGGQHYRRGLARMATLGISSTVSLRRRADDAARGVALEQHLWLPTVDDTPPTLEQLDRAAEFIEQAIGQGRSVYVHCASGVGRAPTAAAAYLVSVGLAPAEAWALIRRSRPFIRPRANQLRQIELFCDAKRSTSDRSRGA